MYAETNEKCSTDHLISINEELHWVKFALCRRALHCQSECQGKHAGMRGPWLSMAAQSWMTRLPTAFALDRSYHLLDGVWDDVEEGNLA